MSLQKKIEQEMSDLALRIIRRAHSSDDEKLVKLSEGYFRLLELLQKCQELEKEPSK